MLRTQPVVKIPSPVKETVLQENECFLAASMITLGSWCDVVMDLFGKYWMKEAKKVNQSLVEMCSLSCVEWGELISAANAVELILSDCCDTVAHN